jgi:hypothetical protein
VTCNETNMYEWGVVSKDLDPESYANFKQECWIDARLKKGLSCSGDRAWKK